MKIVYMHMHLKPGGVTTVIIQQAETVAGYCDVLVISGDGPPEDLSAPHVCIPGLGYDDPDFPENNAPPGETAAAVAAAIYERFPGGCDVIHVHNPLIGKNSRFLDILEMLKEKGFRLFLQVHDFPEDGRPRSYYRKHGYPADCHYGTINARDKRLLEKAGLDPVGVHELFNMVAPMDIRGLEKKAITTVLYPVRGIQRKNIGEAVLLSLYFPEGLPLAITLPPNSPPDWAIYNEWKTFAQQKGLDVIFEASSQYDFMALAANAAFFITTSITEGFGFAFLEPWTAGKLLRGRKLPDICRDFEAWGLNLDHLYESLLVPADWIDLDEFEAQWKQCLSDTFARYGAAIDEPEISNGFARIIANGVIDFSIIREPQQREIICRLISSQDDYARFGWINPVLARFTAFTDFTPVIQPNREAVLKGYSQDAYRRRLMGIYHKVITQPVRHVVDKSILLKQFLTPDNFSLLKWCDHDLG